MMMMSPVTISVPIKLVLFVALDGWTLLSKGWCCSTWIWRRRGSPLRGRDSGASDTCLVSCPRVQGFC
ncbi:type III secretion system protein SpaP [Chromobacterium violaceum]|uniref:Type III secretion system protein SpaP n=1 Tax=Chromobacterium violaceum TaxID=536 RepID=A0A3S4LL51_CHRVL|nr:type III secretion system protein SpaP [Chromobacterium violaceum]